MSDDTSAVLTIGRYQVLDELGRGAMGIVYRGLDPVIGRTVALKTIAFAEHDAESRMLRERLYREASAAGTLTHPNIVTIYDIIEDGSVTAVAMEYVEGLPLNSLIAPGRGLPQEQVLALFEQICAALDFAGSRGIVHRDIKPANILVTPDGAVKILDFGIARLSLSGITQTTTIMGSPSYMSPEQVRGQVLDPRSDLFSAAAVLYEMLTGERAFAGDDAATTMYRIVHESPRPVAHVNPTVTPAVSGVLERALKKDPADRFPSGRELIGGLRRALGSPGFVAFAEPGAAAEGGEPEERRRSPLLLYGAVASGIMVLAIALVMVFGGGFGTPTGTPGGRMAGGGAPPVSPGPASPETAIAGVPPIEAQADPPQGTAERTSANIPPSETAALPVANGSGAKPGEPLPAARPVRPADRDVTPGASAARAETLTAPDRSVPGPVAVRSAPPAPVRTEPPAVPPPASPSAKPAASIPDGPPPLPPAGAAVRSPATPAPIAAAAPAGGGDAILRIDFDSAPYPVTLYAGDVQLGRIETRESTLTVEPGTIRVRAVSVAVFLDADLGSVAVRPGERRTITLPGLSSAVFSVKGEDYRGVRLLIDGRDIPGSYPAQVARIAAGTHRVVYRWVSGASAGRELSETITISAGGHFIVRAALDNGSISVQQLR